MAFFFFAYPVTEFNTFLTEEQDVEGLPFDQKNNRLLIAIKEIDPNSKTYKGIYAFGLNTLEVRQEPVFKINFKNRIFRKINQEKRRDTFKPSETGIDPSTGNILIFAASPPMLLILNPQGTAEKLHFLNEDTFPQPEGLMFDPHGNLYISNEGSPATIHPISIK